MAQWYCRECKRSRPQEQMLPGWNGPWCPNCVWNDVAPLPAGASSISSALDQDGSASDAAVGESALGD
jgi:hypothetical protein